MNTKRTKALQFWVTEDEHGAVHHAAQKAGVSASDYCRDLVLRSVLGERTATGNLMLDEMKKLREELAHVRRMQTGQAKMFHATMTGLTNRLTTADVKKFSLKFMPEGLDEE